MPEAIANARLLTTSEAAAAIGCSYRTVQRGIKAGSIAVVRVSRRVFVPEREVAKIREAGLAVLPSQLDQPQAKVKKAHASTAG